MMKSQSGRGQSLLGLFFLVQLMVFSPALFADSPLDGVWQTGEDNSKVQVTEQDGIVTGKLVSSDNPKATMGTEILRDFKLVNGVWTGKIYAAKRNEVLDATIEPSADSLLIHVKAGLVSKKVTWTRDDSKS